MMRKFTQLLILIGQMTILPLAYADSFPTHLCKFENALLPCNRLAKPIHEAMGTQFEFKPTKWTPLWPNFSIFGGLKLLWDEELRIGHEDSDVQPYDPSKSNIETTALIQPQFDDSFIDEELADYSRWVDRDFRRVLGMAPVENVFHGIEVFELWEKATKAGIICAKGRPPFLSERNIRLCVFARETLPHTPLKREIEYCEFETSIENGVRSSPNCTVVASEAKGRRRVFSARYTSTNFQGGASAGEYTCYLPGTSFDEMKNFVELFVRNIIGQSSKFFIGKDQYDKDIYKAEGINIKDNREKIFLRTYIFGQMENKSKALKRPPRFFMNVNVTISAQASENIIDYREPNQAMTNRIRNRFEEQLQERVRVLSRQGRCVNDYPW